MTKAFLHGRTEAIRTVQPESVEFIKVCTYIVRGRDHQILGSRLLDVLLRGIHRREDQCFTQSM